MPKLQNIVDERDTRLAMRLTSCAFDFTTCLVTGTELTVTGAEAPENTYGHAPGEYVKGAEDAVAFAETTSNLSPIPRGEQRSAASRVVFQACPATDARFVAAFQGEPGWEVPAVVTAEVVGFDQTLEADVLHGTANYLANRWNAGSHPASSAQRAAAKAAGLDAGDVWMTTIMVR